MFASTAPNPKRVEVLFFVNNLFIYMANYYGPAFGPGFAQSTSQPRQMQSIPGQFNQISGGYNGGAVLGANTGGGYKAPVQASSGNGAQNPAPSQPQQQEDPYAGLRNDISASWDQYLNSLSGVGGYLNDSRASQEGIANSQWQQGQDTLNNQKALSLRDIANTTRNAFTAGNNYLGAMGAGDSSAANQYSFAINQQAGKQTGDLNNFVTSKLGELQSTHDQQIQGIAQWFAQQQEALRQQIAQGGLQKSQDINNLSRGILDQAMQATNALKANSQNQYNALLTWAANNSQNIGQLQSNIAQIPGTMGQINMQGGGVGGRPTYGGTVASNGSNTDIFGNPRN